MLRLLLLTLVSAWLATAAAQEKQCYGLDGSALDNTYAPCNPSATHSGCCATKRTNASGDICLDNGLCLVTSSDMIGTIWQSGCTDPTGKDPACSKICSGVASDSTGLATPTSWNVQMCNYGQYCCRASGDKRSCCNNSLSFKVATTSIGALPASSTPTPSPIQAASATTTSPVINRMPYEADSSPVEDTCQKERQTTAIVGGTIGAIFSAIIMALAITIFWMHRRERRQRRLKEHYETQFSQTNAYRKALASTAGSLRGSVFLADVRLKSSESI